MRLQQQPHARSRSGASARQPYMSPCDPVQGLRLFLDHVLQCAAVEPGRRPVHAVDKDAAQAAPALGEEPVLAALADQGVRQSVVTGNVRRAAEVKLAVFGLDAYVRLDEGAYGEDGEGRPELLRAALERANVSPDCAVFLGDTPADVAGGREAGVRVVAVATGRTPASDLRAAGAHTVREGLSHTDRVLAAIGA